MNEQIPADLLAFVQGRSRAQVAKALGMGIGQVSRLANGYWPKDARRTQAAWAAYKARDFQRATSWFLRRVDKGDVVRHAGFAYTGPCLAARVGQVIAVARDEGGGLVGVALDLPAERFALTRVDSSVGAS